LNLLELTLKDHQTGMKYTDIQNTHPPSANKS